MKKLQIGLEDDIPQVLDDNINTRINHIQENLIKNFCKLYINYCFNIFTVTLLTSLYYINMVFFLAVWKIDLSVHF